MKKSEEIFWFLEAEYELIRDWVNQNEAIREEHRKVSKTVLLPDVFVSFEEFWFKK